MMILMWLLTAILFVDCVFLILLILVQLPKKEAGAGVAFGGAATDALFGAGSGTALTKITKYAAGVFFCVAVLMSMLAGQMRKGGSSVVEKLQEKAKASPVLPSTQPGTALPSPSATTPATAPAATQPANTSPAATPSANTTAPAAAAPSTAAPPSSSTPAPQAPKQ